MAIHTRRLHGAHDDAKRSAQPVSHLAADVLSPAPTAATAAATATGEPSEVIGRPVWLSLLTTISISIFNVVENAIAEEITVSHLSI